MSTRTKKVVFEGALGDELDAALELPEGEPRACALFAHCFTCSKDVFAASRISKMLAEKGIAVLRFDFTGLGSSHGDFANTNFSSNVQDLVAAADYLREEAEAPTILIGHSLGGAAVLLAAHEIEEVRAVATIAAPCQPEHVRNLLEDDVDTIESSGEADVKIAGRTFTIKKQFLDDLEAHDVETRIGELRKALLVFHGPRDNVVGIENASCIFTAARHPKSFVSLDDADHLLSRREDAVYVADVLAAWADRYIDARRDVDEEDEPMDERAVVVGETGHGRFQQRISIGPHAFLADEPPDVGGDDSGPSPYELLLSALGACTSMTLRMYADRKEWPLEGVEVRLRHDRRHADDCEDCDEKTRKIDQIDRIITVRGPLDDEQRGRLLEIANRCPVHRTLHGKPMVESSLVPDEGGGEAGTDVATGEQSRGSSSKT